MALTLSHSIIFWICASGPMSVGLDISFFKAKQVYGIPEHADAFALRPTMYVLLYWSMCADIQRVLCALANACVMILELSFLRVVRRAVWCTSMVEWTLGQLELLLGCLFASKLLSCHLPLHWVVRMCVFVQVIPWEYWKKSCTSKVYVRNKLVCIYKLRQGVELLLSNDFSGAGLSSMYFETLFGCTIWMSSSMRSTPMLLSMDQFRLWLDTGTISS